MPYASNAVRFGLTVGATASVWYEITAPVKSQVTATQAEYVVTR